MSGEEGAEDMLRRCCVEWTVEETRSLRRAFFCQVSQELHTGSLLNLFFSEESPEVTESLIHGFENDRVTRGF